MKGLKTLGCLLALLLAAVILFPAKAEAADVAINAANFPDAGFRAFVKKKFDTNKDGKLSAKEAEAVWKIEYNGKDCTSMKGIENFPNLKVLSCQDNKLTELDLSAFPLIHRVWCSGNKIASLDIHLNERLTKAYLKAEIELEMDGTIYYCCYDWDLPFEEYDDDYDWDSDMPIDYVLDVDSTTTIICRPKITSPREITKKTVSSGDKVSLKVKAVSSTSMTYQWYWRKGTSGTWTKVTAASGKKATYTFTAKDKHNGYQYMCRVKNTYGSTNSKVFKLTVKPLPNITSPTKDSTKTVSKGKTATFKVVAENAAKYQWYYRTSKTGSWKMVKASSGKTAAYKLYNAAAKHNGYQYRCKVFNSAGGYVYSKIFTLKVTS
ncbi:MAG: immunoglobulin domain-containing protein [Lachnospiraceae bacterium]|nr:immunoglobulin domain-containing protein [Lachnospiraceae bacterium]